jgi:hypothetical protein
MTARDELVELEHAGWEALSSDGEAATAFYDDVLADDVVMLLPGGLVIDDRDQALTTMGGAPWTSFDLSDERVVVLGDSGAVLTYRARADRGGQHYDALFASTYVRVDGAWRLAVHQQTPL